MTSLYYLTSTTGCFGSVNGRPFTQHASQGYIHSPSKATDVQPPTALVARVKHSVALTRELFAAIEIHLLRVWGHRAWFMKTDAARVAAVKVQLAAWRD